MDESAESLREQRKRETARALTQRARELTGTKGFAGFTIEELCTDVGVSRRTFFNYFESKENAVLGFSGDDPRMTALDEAFAVGDAVSERELLGDFVELTTSRWELFDPSREAPAIFEMLEHEPRLIKSVFAQLEIAAKQDARLIERRSGWPEGDLRASVIVHCVGTLVRMCAEAVFAHSPDTFRELMTHRLALARTAFTLDPKAP
jgi:AcrR family transcriptional regulator